MYGFASDDEYNVFFHIHVFSVGEFSKAPPIVGEPVEVIFNPQTSGKAAPPAQAVSRLEEPKSYFGTVDSFRASTGYGFIRTEDDQTFFLHRTQMMDGRFPQIGMKVHFYAGDFDGRLRAYHVTLLESDLRAARYRTRRHRSRDE